MKKTIIAMALLLVAGSVQQIDAQQRRRTTTARKTTTVRKTTTQPPKQERFVKEVALYDVKLIDFCVDADFVYYVEKMPNNAVMKIDRKTGEVSTVIPGIANVYEGRRPVINRISIAGGRLVFQYGDYPGSVGILVDGKYQGSKEWERVFRAKGNYILITRHDGGTELYNVRNMKLVNIPNIPDTGMDGSQMEIDPNGCVWYPYKDEKKFGAVRLTSSGKVTFYDLSTQSYIVSEGISSVGFSDPITRFTSLGSFLYVSCKRRIYRLNMLQPTSWEEYAKIPPTLDSCFKLFWPDWKGNILNNDRGYRNSHYFYRVGAFDNPQVVGRGQTIETGISKFGWTEIWTSLSKVRVDLDNNFVIGKEDGLRIFNPDGVVGYEKARGRIYKP